MAPAEDLKQHSASLVVRLAKCIIAIDIREKLKTDIDKYKAKVERDYKGKIGEIVAEAVNDLGDTIAECRWPEELQATLQTFITKNSGSEPAKESVGNA